MMTTKCNYPHEIIIRIWLWLRNWAAPPSRYSTCSRRFFARQSIPGYYSFSHSWCICRCRGRWRYRCRSRLVCLYKWGEEEGDGGSESVVDWNVKGLRSNRAEKGQEELYYYNGTKNNPPEAETNKHCILPKLEAAYNPSHSLKK